LSTYTSEAQSKQTTQRITGEPIPRPDYGSHPAYGRAFPNPSIGLRARALARFLPWLAFVAGKRVLLFDRLPTLPDYEGPMSGGIANRVAASGRYAPLIVRGLAQQWSRPFTRKTAPALSPQAASLLETLERDGIAPTRLPTGEIAAIRAQLESHERRLLEKREAKAVRSFEGNQTWLNRKEAGPLYVLLEEIFRRNGIMAAAEAYLKRPVVVKHMLLQINDAKDAYQRGKFADVGLQDPATNYMHLDTSEEIVKCMVYLTEVTDRTGPFGYVRGSNRVSVGTFEGLFRRANDRAGLSGYAPETRRMFMALPSPLRHKSMFGSDLLDGAPETKRVVDAEYQFVSADGNAAIFDNLGIHRGGLVREGERRVLIANLG
jgi:phytanoyl-CoA dioxygenase PhyH